MPSVCRASASGRRPFKAFLRAISTCSSERYLHVDSRRTQPLPRTSCAFAKSRYGFGVKDTERTFVQALIRASKCREHGPEHVRNLQGGKVGCNGTACLQRLSSNNRRVLCRAFSTEAGPQLAVVEENKGAEEEERTFKPSKDQLKLLVDSYWGPDDQATSLRQDQVTTIPPVRTLRYYSRHTSTDSTITLDEDVRNTIARLEELLEDDTTPHEVIFDEYHKLEAPRTLHLPDDVLRRLLQHLSIVEHKDESSTLRYLEVIADARSVERPLKQQEWTSAISFAGRCFKQVSTSELRSAMQLWQEMEKVGVESSHITFNVLFDIATKAGNFAIAEMLVQELEARNLPLNRHFRTGLMYHHGLRGDGDAVRRAYHDLIDAGETVDTAVISCLIASLLRCGESVAAEHVFHRMKLLDARYTDRHPPQQDWRISRKTGWNLDLIMQRSRAVTRRKPAEETPLKGCELETEYSFTPTLRTYKPLLYYYAVISGNVDRVIELVEEMAHYNIPVDGTIFVHLFRGFVEHGGLPYSPWTQRRLESTFSAFCVAVDDDDQNCYVSAASAELAIRAYAKCVGSERTLEVWDEVRSRWKQQHQKDGAMQQAETLLAKLLNDMHSPA